MERGGARTPAPATSSRGRRGFLPTPRSCPRCIRDFTDTRAAGPVREQPHRVLAEERLSRESAPRSTGRPRSRPPAACCATRAIGLTRVRNRVSIVRRHKTMKPVIRIDVASTLPAYRQIANALRTLLVAGSFPVGTPLPTVRQLAVDLAVHHNTVAEAYRVLSDEGWLDLRRRRGAIVRDRTQPTPPPQARASLMQRLRELTAEAQASGLPPRVIAESMRSVATQLTAATPRKA